MGREDSGAQRRWGAATRVGDVEGAGVEGGGKGLSATFPRGSVDFI